jgi:hypothetical protein
MTTNSLAIAAVLLTGPSRRAPDRRRVRREERRKDSLATQS